MKQKESYVGGPVAVLHGAVAADARPDEQDVLVQVRAVSGSLRRLGFAPVPVATDLDLAATAATLRRLQPRLVFNLVESIGGRDRLQCLAPALLESLPVPFTGCGSTAVTLCGSKLSAKRLLSQAGIYTPPWALPAEIAAGATRLPYPALLKSGWDHASFGLEDVYGSAEALEQALEGRRHDRSASEGPADSPPVAELFAEAYVEGREFNLSLLEEDGRAEVLSPAEMRFVDYPEGKPRIVGYAAKWSQGSFEFTHTVRRFDFGPDDESLLGRLSELARRCWSLFELSGYARVDFRVDAGGQPWVLEINTNPCLSPDAGFVAAAEQSGLGFDRVIERLVRAALEQRVAKPSGTAGHRAAPSGGLLLQPATVALREQVLPADVEGVRSIVASAGFFSGDEIQLAVELVQERLARGEASGYNFLFADPPEAPGRALGYTCFGLIPCTTASYDLYWIAVHGDGRGRGLGSELLEHSEQRIRSLGGRRIYVETSSRPQYGPTRGFYSARGYRVETILESFYSPGDGKVIFVKELE